MKKSTLMLASLALELSNLFTGAARAGNFQGFDLKACTETGKTASIYVEVTGIPTTSADLEKTLQALWNQTARNLDGDPNRKADVSLDKNGTIQVDTHIEVILPDNTVLKGHRAEAAFEKAFRANAIEAEKLLGLKKGALPGHIRPQGSPEITGPACSAN